MAFFKRNIFKISLLLLLAAAGALCIYAISNYHSSAAPTQNITAPRNFQQGNRNQSPEMTNQTPGGQSPGRDTNQQPVETSGGHMGGGFASGGTKYAPQLIIYSIIFLVLFAAAYCLLTSKKLKIHPGNEKLLILTLTCVGLLLRFSSATLMDGHPFDLNLFRNWAASAANNLFGVYDNSRIDYPPLYMYVLYLIGKLAGITALSPYFILLLKLPSMLADIATSLIIYRLARKYLAAEISILLSAFYIFNPAVLINSTFWGQVDSFFTLIVIAAVFLLSEKKPARQQHCSQPPY
jgi:Gpi18-like mannosyltransferase